MILWFYDPGHIKAPVLLGASEQLGISLPLNVVGVCVESAPQICSERRFKQEETHATGWVGVSASLDPSSPRYSGCWADVVASPAILGISEHLRVGLPLGVLGVGAQLAP